MKINSTKELTKIVMVYFVASCLYIFFSDRIILFFYDSASLITLFQTVKGLGFVFTTSAILFYFLYQLVSKVERGYSEQLELKTNLALANDKYRLIFENSSEAIFLSDPEGNIYAANQEACKIFNVSEHVLFENGRNFILNPNNEEFLKAYNQREKKGWFKGELCFKKGDGSEFLGKISSSIFVDSIGKKHTINIVEDITEKKRIELDLISSENKYKNLILNSPSAIYVNLNDKVVLANQACLKLFGANNETEIIGKSPYELFHEDYHNEIKYRIEFQKKVGKPVPLIEEKILRFDGVIVDVEVAASPFELEGETALHVILNDITGRKKIEEALKKSEENYRILFQSNPTAMWVYDLETYKFIEVNNYAINKYGYSKNEFLNMNILEIRPEEDKEPLKEYLAKPRSEIRQSGEWRHKLKNNEIIYVEVISHLIKYNNKDAALTMVTDITEKRKAEKHLKENEERMRLLVEGTSYFFFYTQDLSGKITYISPSVEQITGHKVNKWIGKNDWFAVDITTNNFINKHLQDVLSGNEIKKPYKLEILNNKNEIILLEIYDMPLIKDDTIIGIQGIARDVTLSNKLIQKIEKLSIAVDQSPVSIIMTDLQGNIEYVNPYFTQVTGFTFDEVINNNPRILKSGEQSREYYDHLWQTISSGAIWTGIFLNKRKNGKLFWESALITPIKDEEGNILNYVAVKEDITEKVKRETELKKHKEHLEEIVKVRTEELNKLNNDLQLQLERQKELETQLESSLAKEKEINELKTRFIATVSHEFRTPLSSLLSSTQLINRYSKKWTDDKLNEHYKRIENMVNHLTELLDDVLTISRADREILKNQPEEENVNELFAAFMEQVKPIMKPTHKIIFVNEYSKETIFIDKKLLNHIVVNLLNNALKYSPMGGEVNVNISENKYCLNILVKDNGIGIPADEISHLFEPFFRAKNTHGTSGTGLGLNILKRSLDILGGTVKVTTKLNNGTTFLVTIPV